MMKNNWNDESDPGVWSRKVGASSAQEAFVGTVI